MTDEGVLEAARAVRPYLPDLVGPEAERLDDRVAELLSDFNGREEVIAALRLVLDSHEGTSSFLDWVLADAPHYRPPSVQPDYLRDSESFSPLAGAVTPILHSGKYRCPKGDYVWYRPAVGAAVPACPTHGSALRRL